MQHQNHTRTTIPSGESSLFAPRLCWYYHKFADNEYSVKVWKNEKLGKYISIDSETTVVPFHMTPEIVTMQVYSGNDVVYYVPVKKIKLFLNKHYDSIFILMNAPFDW